MHYSYRTLQQHDQRFPFLPFLAGLAISPFLYGGYGFGPRPFYGPPIAPYPYYRPYPFYGPYPYGGLYR